MSSNSNNPVIAAVTATLADKLSAAIGDFVPGARVTRLNPALQKAASGGPVVNVYLFCIRANDVRRTLSDSAQQEPAAERISVDLDYVISFDGDGLALDSQRMADVVVRLLHNNPVITVEEIQRTSAAIPWLAGLDAADVGPVRLMSNWLPADAALSVFRGIAPGTPYLLSLFCTASGVLL